MLWGIGSRALRVQGLQVQGFRVLGFRGCSLLPTLTETLNPEALSIIDCDTINLSLLGLNLVVCDSPALPRYVIKRIGNSSSKMPRS